MRGQDAPFRGSLDGSDPVENVVPSETHRCRVRRLGLWVGEEGVRGTKLCQGLSGREREGQTLERNDWDLVGRSRRFPRERGSPAPGTSPRHRGCADARGTHHQAHERSLCNLRWEKPKRKRAVSGQIKEPVVVSDPTMSQRVQRFERPFVPPGNRCAIRHPVAPDAGFTAALGAGNRRRGVGAHLVRGSRKARVLEFSKQIWRRCR